MLNSYLRADLDIIAVQNANTSDSTTMNNQLMLQITVYYILCDRFQENSRKGNLKSIVEFSS